MRIVIAWVVVFAMTSAYSIGQVQPQGASDDSIFKAIDAKQLDVKVVALGAHKANFIFTNKTDKPLDLQLPDHFAAVPVLGQFGGGPFGAPLGGGQNGGLFGGQQGAGQFGAGMAGGQGGGSQAIGGGFNQNGGNGMGAGNGFGVGGGNFQGAGMGQGNQNFGRAGFFRVEPGKSRKVQADMVCLEYGKQDPNPRLQYAIVPLNTVTSDPAIEQLCKDMARGKLTQNVAQALAWHIANGLSWEQLAKIHRSESHLAGNQPYFSGRELNLAMHFLSELQTTQSTQSLATR